MSKPQTVDVTVAVVVPAAAETLYDLVTDITRMGEWSPETVAAEWVGGATRAAVGVRFKGTNVLGKTRWSTKPAITAAVPGREFAFEVPGASGGKWRYSFEPVPEGTRVVESVRQDKPSPALIRYFQRRAGVTDRAEHLRGGMHATLARLGAAAVEVERRSA